MLSKVHISSIKDYENWLKEFNWYARTDIFYTTKQIYSWRDNI